MRLVLQGLAALVVGLGWSAGCGGAVNGASSDGGSGSDDATSSSSGGSTGSSSGAECGTPGQACCNGAACDNGLMCSGGLCIDAGTGSSSGSGGGSGLNDGGGGGMGGGDGSGGVDGGPVTDATVPPFDGSLPPLDAALGSLDAAPAGLAGFAFIVNDVVQSPMNCPGTDWEYPPYPGTVVNNNGCMPPNGGVCPGIESVIIVNTSAIDMAYIAGPWWSGPDYAPGGYPGGDFAAGVLAPGAYADITAFYNTGLVAIVGSAYPFTAADAAFASDEGTTGWPQGVAGSGGSTTMYVAEIEVPGSCQPVFRAWR